MDEDARRARDVELERCHRDSIAAPVRGGDAFTWIRVHDLEPAQGPVLRIAGTRSLQSDALSPRVCALARTGIPVATAAACRRRPASPIVPPACHTLFP